MDIKSEELVEGCQRYLDELEKVAGETQVFVKWNAVHGVWNAFFKSINS